MAVIYRDDIWWAHRLQAGGVRCTLCQKAADFPFIAVERRYVGRGGN
jgi:hypothetical protein